MAGTGGISVAVNSVTTLCQQWASFMWRGWYTIL